MSRTPRTRRSAATLLLVVLVAAGALAGCGEGGGSGAEASGTLRLQDVTVDRPSNPTQTAVRLVIDNGTAQPDTLLSVSSPIAGATSIHRSTEDDRGISTMRPVPELDVPARSQVTFAPGGLHVMLEDLTGPLAEGDTVPLTFTFAVAGDVAVDATVTPPGGDLEEHDHDQ